MFVSPLRVFFRTRIYRIQRMLRSVGGTVFQTALPSLLVIPRLRPGLLSLRSVLSSRQHSMFVVCKKFSLEAILRSMFVVCKKFSLEDILRSMFVVGKKICLEDNTERSESNPGRSLGITNNKGRAVLKTVPH